MTRFVTTFLEFSKQKVVGMSTAMKFMLAHVCCNLNGGHAMYAGYVKPFSNDSFRKRVIDSKTASTSTMGLFDMMQINNQVAQKELLNKYAKSAPLSELFKIYKQICVKST